MVLQTMSNRTKSPQQARTTGRKQTERVNPRRPTKPRRGLTGPSGHRREREDAGTGKRRPTGTNQRNTRTHQSEPAHHKDTKARARQRESDSKQNAPHRSQQEEAHTHTDAREARTTKQTTSKRTPVHQHRSPTPKVRAHARTYTNEHRHRTTHIPADAGHRHKITALRRNEDTTKARTITSAEQPAASGCAHWWPQRDQPDVACVSTQGRAQHDPGRITWPLALGLAHGWATVCHGRIYRARGRRLCA